MTSHFDPLSWREAHKLSKAFVTASDPAEPLLLRNRFASRSPNEWCGHVRTLGQTDLACWDSDTPLLNHRFSDVVALLVSADEVLDLHAPACFLDALKVLKRNLEFDGRAQSGSKEYHGGRHCQHTHGRTALRRVG